MTSIYKTSVGQVFGKLTVVDAGAMYGHHAASVCRCECGRIVKRKNSWLLLGKSKACHKGKCAPRGVHGMSTDPAYKPTYLTWYGMISRCSNPLCGSWKHYGGSGITVCERWMKFEKFIEDMGVRPPGFTLDRIDNSKGYEPSNCRWADRFQQSNNRSVVRILSHNGKSCTLREWSSTTGIPQQLLYARMKKGWEPADILRTEKRVKRKVNV